MITLFNKRYAKNDREFISTLFDGPTTAAGYYRKQRNGILLLDMQRSPIAFVHQRGFIVTAHPYEGHTRYMFGLSELTRETLGAPDSPSAQHDAALAVMA